MDGAPAFVVSSRMGHSPKASQDSSRFFGVDERATSPPGSSLPSHYMQHVKQLSRLPKSAKRRTRRRKNMPSSVNVFGEPESYDHFIYEKESQNKVGELRVKPSSILWKPKGAHKYFSAPLDDFIEWMKDKKTVAK
jgi:hypothetical protein